MPNVLRNIVVTGNLVPGVPTSLPHGLQDAEGRPILPDRLASSVGEVVITAVDATNVTVRNDGVAAQSANILVERWHTIPRALPAGALTIPGLPFIGGGGSGGSGLATNVRVPPGTSTLRVIYARPGGNDVTGDGTLGNPYATLARSLQDMPNYVAASDRYIFDITGIDEDMAVWGSQFSFNGGYPVPAVDSNGDLGFDFAPPVDPAFFFGFPFSIQAALADVVTGLAVLSVTADPDTAMGTINLVGVPLVPGAHVGQFVRNPATGSILGVVASNTASALEMCASAASIGAPAAIDIVDTGATLRNSGAFGAALFRNGGSSIFGLYGVQFGPVGAGFKSSMVYQQPQGYMYNQYCRFEGISVLGGAQSAIANGPVESCHVTDDVSFEVPVSHRGTFFQNVDYGIGGGSFGAFALNAIFDGGSGYTNGSGSVEDAGSFFLSAGEVRNCTRGIAIIGGGNGNRINNHRFTGNAGEGILISERAHLFLQKAVGVNGGAAVGLRIESGAQVNVSSATTTVTGGAGDVKIGGLAAQTWASFFALVPADLTDLGAANPQLCRLY